MLFDTNILVGKADNSVGAFRKLLRLQRGCASKQEAWANKTTGVSPNLWARAMGWYAMALVDTLPYFPQDHPERKSLIAVLNRLAVAVTRYQDPDTGLWYQVMDKPKAAGNYYESSAACMFTYALAKGVRLGYLDRKYQQNASRAYRAILKRFVKPDSDGRLTLTDTDYSAGLGGKPYRNGSYEYYIHEKVGPNDPKGIGAFLLASSEMEITTDHQANFTLDRLLRVGYTPRSSLA